MCDGRPGGGAIYACMDGYDRVNGRSPTDLLTPTWRQYSWTEAADPPDAGRRVERWLSLSTLQQIKWSILPLQSKGKHAATVITIQPYSSSNAVESGNRSRQDVDARDAPVACSTCNNPGRDRSQAVNESCIPRGRLLTLGGYLPFSCPSFTSLSFIRSEYIRLGEPYGHTCAVISTTTLALPSTQPPQTLLASTLAVPCW